MPSQRSESMRPREIVIYCISGDYFLNTRLKEMEFVHDLAGSIDNAGYESSSQQSDLLFLLRRTATVESREIFRSEVDGDRASRNVAKGNRRLLSRAAVLFLAKARRTVLARGVDDGRGGNNSGVFRVYAFRAITVCSILGVRRSVRTERLLVGLKREAHVHSTRHRYTHAHARARAHTYTETRV